MVQELRKIGQEDIHFATGNTAAAETATSGQGVTVTKIDATHVMFRNRSGSVEDFVSSGIDADQVDGFHASQAAGAGAVVATDSDGDIALSVGGKIVQSIGARTVISGPSGSGETILAQNCIRTATGWDRKNTGAAAAILTLDQAGNINLYACSAGANPIASWDVHNGTKVWHGGNDGTSSTLDADLLDGLHGTGYFNIYDYISYAVGRYVTDADDSACRNKAFTAYYHYSPYTNKPTEATSDGIILTYCYSSGYATQYWMSLDTGVERGCVWIRATTDGSSWSGWMRCTPKDSTFTPVIEGTSTAGSGTYTQQTGTYQIDGKWVLFDLAVTWTAHTGTGNIIVTGLPFTNQGVYAPVSIMADNLTFSGQLVAAVYPSASYVYLFTQSSGAALAAVPMDTSANLWIAGAYRRN